MTSTTVPPASSATLFTSKPTILPNAHPYAIKTTSSAILSRTNSSPHSAHSVKHRYVPPSPTRQRHRHTSSVLSADITLPPPLPVPPTFPPASPTRATFSPINDPIFRRLRRAESLPPTAVVPIFDNTSVMGDNQSPRDPKQWSSDDLASYIASSLQADNELSAADQEDLLHAIKEQSVTGKDFLRLTDADLASMSLATAQRLYLLRTSRELRADILRSRTWVDSYRSKDTSDGVYTQRTFGSSPSSNGGLYNLSTSSMDSIIFPSTPVRTDEELPLSPAMTLNRSNSVSDSSTQRYRDLARMRIRRRGKVRGLVETWERENGAVSGSEGSMSGSDAESDSDIPSVESPRLSSPSNSSSSLGNPPPPYTSPGNEDEPTMEQLLASPGSIKGARVWEEDCYIGETVKRIPTGVPASLSFALPPPKTADAVEIRAESTEHSVDYPLINLKIAGSCRTNKRKRVVTAIFTGGSDRTTGNLSESKIVDEVPQISLNLGEIMDVRTEPDVEIAEAESVTRPKDVLSAPVQVAESSPAIDAVIAALEASIADTRAQLDIFQARLEVVEAQIATHEAVNGTQSQPEYTLQSVRSRIQTRVPDADNFAFSDYRLGLKNFARTIIAHTMGWVYPYTHPGSHPHPEARASRSRAASRSPVRPRVLPAFRLPSVVMFSFVLCAAILRKVAFGKGVRGR